MPQEMVDEGKGPPGEVLQVVSPILVDDPSGSYNEAEAGVEEEQAGEAAIRAKATMEDSLKVLTDATQEGQFALEMAQVVETRVAQLPVLDQRDRKS